MFIVTGSKRSGCSLMMQLLDKAGIDFIGEKFPKECDRVKNPEGIYESAFYNMGLNNTTTPWNHNEKQLLKYRAIKLSPVGLSRTDSEYIEKVILVIRHWKSCLQVSTPQEYFASYYSIIQSLVKRRLDVLTFDYDVLVDNAKDTCINLKKLIGVGRFDLAPSQIKKKLRTVDIKNYNSVFPEEFCEILDKLYQGLFQGRINDEIVKTLPLWNNKIMQWKPPVTKKTKEKKNAKNS